ncbi:MAG: TrmH family RNA methyltransferase [Desulfobacula sp.]|jgi:tRNA G18 (ribose-2'-O)-methylase SpoU
MDSFLFTKKKFLSLSIESRNSQIVEWLSGFYQKLTTNRINQGSFELFTLQYNEILGWNGMAPFIPPDTDKTKLWIECISDRIHLHRSAAGRIPRDYDLLETVRTGDAELSPPLTDINCHIALDGIRSLFNVGSIFRICEAAGFSSVILGNTLGKDHPGIKKTAMGAEKWVKEEIITDLAGCLYEKKKAGYRIIGIETIKDSRSFCDYPWQKNTIVVFGNEEYGISSHVLEACDEFVHIPMFGKKNSINIATAVSVICFQVTTSVSISSRKLSISMMSPG